MDPTENNQRIYERMRDELIISQRSNSDNFDKAILSLSSAGLGITIAFISNLIDLSKANLIIVLYLAWILFILAIISTVISFLVSQRGIDQQLVMAEQLYIYNKQVDQDRVTRISGWVNKLNILSAIAFIRALLLIIVFSITNIAKGAFKMNEGNKNNTTMLTEGKPINNLQKVITPDLRRGLPINNLQPVVKPSQANTTNNSNKNAG